jgi:RNA recognition motif-containing protein
MTGAGAPAGGSVTGSGFGGGPQRSFEERAAAREQMMSNIRDASQQDRRVYVGNLSYDVKWHHLKDFMRQGESFIRPREGTACIDELQLTTFPIL